jgi:murein DD-endopeptidase MepM/ murein hydrolase activator NlpD
MRRLYFLFLFMLFVISVISQDSVKHVVLDTIDYGRFRIVLFENQSWEYVEHEQVMKIISTEDSIRTFEHIYKNKVYVPDTSTLFSENWETMITHAYGGIDYFKVSDTLAIPLVSDTMIFTMPSPGFLQSPFGWRWGRLHNGIDLKLNSGDTVLAAFDGIVRFAGWNKGGYGNLVIIRHYNGLETYYSHLSKVEVERNQKVKSGDLIGLGGRTGRAYGDHLHFELRYMDNGFDPQLIIDVENKQLIRDTLVLMPEHFAHVKELSQAQYHTVKSGDTLWGVSRRFGVSVNYLCNLNGISDDTPLKIGQKLRVR